MDATEEYGQWYRYNRHRLMKFAYKLGLKGEDAQDAVSSAVRRTLEPTSAFPRDTPEHWWTWHCGVIRSQNSNAARGRARAHKARATGAIQGRTVPWTQVITCKKLKKKPSIPAQGWSATTVPHNVGVCPCGMMLARWIERESTRGPYVIVIGCRNGHRKYGEVQS